MKEVEASDTAVEVAGAAFQQQLAKLTHDSAH
jgi:hypothetical protein